MPGGIDIRGVQALVKDPGDFGLYYQMKTASFRDLVDAGVVICGSPATVREQLREFCTQYGIGTLHAMLGFGSLPRDLAMKNIQLFAEEVAPLLRDLWTDTRTPHHWWPERLGGDPTPVTPGASATEGAPTAAPTQRPSDDADGGLMTTTADTARPSLRRPSGCGMADYRSGSRSPAPAHPCSTCTRRPAWRGIRSCLTWPRTTPSTPRNSRAPASGTPTPSMPLTTSPMLS